MESVRDYPVTVAMSANATGKTHGAARIGIWWYKCFPDSQVYTAAAPPESNLRRLLWGEISSIVEKHPDIFKTDAVTNLNIAKSARHFLAGVTIPMSGSEAVREAKFSGKHAPYLLFILDEGDAIPDECYRGIESCLSGQFGRLLVMFNPRSETGEAYRMIRDGRANVVQLSAFDHPNVISGIEAIPGAVSRPVTVRRINEWCRPLTRSETPDAECFVLPDFLEGATATSQNGAEYPPLKPGYYKIMQPEFAYMVLGRYPAQGSKKLISREWITAARSRWDSYVSEHGETPPAYTMAVMGLDVAEYGADSNVACFRFGGWVAPLVTWTGIDPIRTGERAALEYKGRAVSRANVDATGVGAGVAPHLTRLGCPSTPIKMAAAPTGKTESGEFKILRDQLWWQCREWLRTDAGAMLPPDELLIEELLCPSYQIDRGKIRVLQKKDFRELLKRSPDRADALVLTFARGGAFAGLDLS